MNLSRSVRPLLGVIAALFVVACVTWAPARADSRHWVCPPCHASCDTLVFDHPGICPQCGMALVEQTATLAAAAAEPPHKKVAILLFEGVEIIDSMGPYEVFGAADYDVYTVGATAHPVSSAMGQALTPKYSFADAPPPDVLVVPGGSIHSAVNDPATLDYVRRVTAADVHTLSVCNGAFILASAGLLDGLGATTTYHNLPKLRAQYPKVHVVENQRWVDNGKIITTGGLSAGIDGALHVIERMDGRGYAQRVALGEEYNWTPQGGYARAALADRLIPAVDLDAMGTFRVVRTEGTRDHWEMEVRGTTELSADALLGRIGHALETQASWAATGRPASAAGGTRGDWRFTDGDGGPWKGTLTIEPDPAASHAYTAKLTIGRAG